MPEWKVPRYTELKALGSGGFGDVMLARHDPTGTLVAIKYLRRDLLADAEFAQLFRAEATVLASLDDIEVQVWNPQSGKGPAICHVIAGSGDPAQCSGR